MTNDSDHRTGRSNRMVVLTALVMILLLSFIYGALSNLGLLVTFEGRLFFSRLVLIWAGLCFITLACLFWQRFVLTVIGFFSAQASPINLAVFRIVFFCWLFSYPLARVVSFAKLPAEFRAPPPGLDWLMHWLPINETVAMVLGVCFYVSCSSAMIGFWTRTSALLSLIFGFFFLSIPHFYGKVNHNHHLLWFAMILAASRCSDVFSCDAVIAAWKRADHGVTAPPEASQVYALPLRFLWLLMGLIYFFPGFAKLWISGFDWIFSDALKFFMYGTWTREIDGWIPFFRVDKYPVLLRLGAFGTVIFELSFIFLLFFPQTRVFAALGGVIFHEVIKAFMRINFISLQICYVMFFDWHAIFRRVGERLYKDQMYVVYDGSCGVSRRAIASLRTFDIFGRVTYLNASDKNDLSDLGLISLRSIAPIRYMHATVGAKTWTGFSGYRRLTFRIPVFWPILPFLYIWPITRLGNRIYQHVADARMSSIPGHTSFDGERQRREIRGACYPAVIVGTFLLVAYILCASQGATKTWPFAVYPTFARMRIKPTMGSLAIRVKDLAGKETDLSLKSLREALGPSRYGPFIWMILRTDDPIARRNRFLALWKVAAGSTNVRDISSVRFYRLTLRTDPERWRENPVRQTLVYELQLLEKGGRIGNLSR